MKYLCLIYTDEQLWAALSDTERQELQAQCLATNEAMQRSGHLLAAETLAPVSSAVTLRSRQGETLITEGPGAATKKQLDGFYWLEARDLNEALHLVEHIPPARYGCVEIRPCDTPVNHPSD